MSLFVLLQRSDTHGPPSIRSFHLSSLPPSAQQVLPVRRQEEVKGQGKRVGSACQETYVDSLLSSQPSSTSKQPTLSSPLCSSLERQGSMNSDTLSFLQRSEILA